MNKHIIYCLVFVLGLCDKASAQTPLSEIRLDDFYVGQLDEIFDQISKSKKVQFEFDRSKLAKIRTADRPFNEPLDQWLTTICQKNKLKWYQQTNGTIHIIGRYENPEANAVKQRPPQDRGLPTRQNLTVKGVVIDQTSGEALPFVTVRVAGEALGATSNVDGYFTILNVPTDTNTLVFTYLGYKQVDIYLSPGTNTNELPVEMVPSGNELAEVVVSAAKEDLLQTATEVSMIKMSTAKIALLPSLGEKDIFRAFQLMPGISAVNEQTSGLYVRGGTPDQVLTQFDGFTVYNVDHLFGFYSAFNANAIKDVQLFKGAFDAKYGGRLASVVDITGKDGNNRGFNAGFDIGMLSANAWMEQPFGEQATSIVTLRRSWRGPIYNKIFDKFGKSTSGEELPQDGPFAGTSVASWFYDINLKTTWKPNKRDVFSFSFYNGKDKLDNSQSPDLPFGGGGGIQFTDLTDWGNTGASVKWSARWNDRLYTNSLVSYSTYFSNRDRTVSGSFEDAAGDSQDIRRGTLEYNRLKDFSARQDWEWRANDQNQIGFGAAATYNNLVYTFSQNDTTAILDRNDSGLTVAAYVQNKMSLFNEKLVLTPGLRATRFSPTAKTYLEPRFTAQFQLTKKLKIKGAAGHYKQFVKRVIREDIFSGSRDFWVLADDDRLPVASSTQYIGGVSWENKNWLFDAEAYYKPLDGLSEYSLRTNPRPTGPNGGDINYEENFFDGMGEARGIDFLLQKKYGRWNGWVGYTIGRVLHNFEAFGSNDFYASHDVTHEFKFTQLYKWRRWDFSATFVYATGKPYTAPEGAYTIQLLDGSTQGFLNVSAKNAYRLPDYHRLDIAANYHFHWGNSPASLNISIFNVYGRNNVWYKQFEVVEDQLLETNTNYLGFTPNLTLSFKFR